MATEIFFVDLASPRGFFFQFAYIFKDTPKAFVLI